VLGSNSSTAPSAGPKACDSHAKPRAGSKGSAGEKGSSIESVSVVLRPRRILRRHVLRPAASAGTRVGAVRKSFSRPRSLARSCAGCPAVQSRPPFLNARRRPSPRRWWSDRISRLAQLGGESRSGRSRAGSRCCRGTSPRRPAAARPARLGRRRGGIAGSPRPVSSARISAARMLGPRARSFHAQRWAAAWFGVDVDALGMIGHRSVARLWLRSPKGILG
jgi:hypothetical protein